MFQKFWIFLFLKKTQNSRPNFFSASFFSTTYWQESSLFIFPHCFHFTIAAYLLVNIPEKLITYIICQHPMSRKATDIISLISYAICAILMVIRIVRMILFDLPPMTYLTVAIGFFFLLGCVFLLISTDKDSMWTHIPELIWHPPTPGFKRIQQTS